MASGPQQFIEIDAVEFEALFSDLPPKEPIHGVVPKLEAAGAPTGAPQPA